MFFHWSRRKGSTQKSQKNLPSNREGGIRVSEFSYSWIITGKLAIGPIPRYEEDWLLLEKNGIKKRFSCCYPQEHIFLPIPQDWQTKEVSLPDHRFQEDLSPEKLVFALHEAINFLSYDNKPMYLHCFAGQERSTLLATGIVSLVENKDLFEGLAYVRQCYPKARPLYEHLDILEQAFKKL
jgi:hypothetical protein